MYLACNPFGVFCLHSIKIKINYCFLLLVLSLIHPSAQDAVKVTMAPRKVLSVLLRRRPGTTHVSFFFVASKQTGLAWITLGVLSFHRADQALWDSTLSSLGALFQLNNQKKSATILLPLNNPAWRRFLFSFWKWDTCASSLWSYVRELLVNWGLAEEDHHYHVQKTNLTNL